MATPSPFWCCGPVRGARSGRCAARGHSAPPPTGRHGVERAAGPGDRLVISQYRWPSPRATSTHRRSWSPALACCRSSRAWDGHCSGPSAPSTFPSGHDRSARYEVASRHRPIVGHRAPDPGTAWKGAAASLPASVLERAANPEPAVRRGWRRTASTCTGTDRKTPVAPCWCTSTAAGSPPAPRTGSRCHCCTGWPARLAVCQRELPPQPTGWFPRLRGRRQARPGLGAHPRRRVRGRPGDGVRGRQLRRRLPGRLRGPDSERPEYQPGFADADTSVSAAIGLYGDYGQTDADRPESSPRVHVEPARAAVPARARRHRQRRPIAWARDFARALKETSEQPVVYTELPGAQHSLDYFDSLRRRLVVDQIEAFAAWVPASPECRPRDAVCPARTDPAIAVTPPGIDLGPMRLRGRALPPLTQHVRLHRRQDAGLDPRAGT